MSLRRLMTTRLAGSGRVTTDMTRSCPDSFLLALLLALACGRFPNRCRTRGSDWRRGSESNEVFTDYQPQYPDLRGDFKPDFTGLQEVSNTTRQLPDLSRHTPAYYSVIEEIVEGFVEGFLTGLT